MYTNANGLLNKLSELKIIIDKNRIDIVCVTETHFNESLEEAEISIPGFTPYRGDRNFKLDRSAIPEDVSSCGGSVIYVKNSILVKDCSHDSSLDSTSIIIKMDVGDILIGCLYRSTSLNDSQDTDFHSFLSQKVNSDQHIEKILFGDFNFTDISWLSGNVVAPANSVNNYINSQQRFMNSINSAGYSWLLTDQVTRRRMVAGTLQESLLDQVLFSEESLISDFRLGPPIGKSDHMTIFVELNIFKAAPINNTSEVKRNWSKLTESDILDLATTIDFGYSENLPEMTVDKMWGEIHGKLSKITDSVPQCSTPKKNKICDLPWINSSLKRAFRVKEKAWKEFDTDCSHENLYVALSKEGKFNDTEIKARLKYEKTITHDLKHNSKAFYSYLRSRRTVKSMVTFLSREDGSMTKDDKDTAECFSDAFSSVFVREPLGPLPQHCYTSDYDSCGDVIIDVNDVEKELKSLNIYKSFGPDNIHPKLLRALSRNTSFVNSLTELYRKCVIERRIPGIWKTANVVALHKKDSKKDPLNYRPVSLTCILCKVYEKFVRKHILNHVERKININQHGFVNKKSCFSNLLETVDAVIELLEAGHPVDVFYFDFCKAFDSVPHYRLLTKLENYGITGSTLEIICDFLSGRSLRTSVRGNYSLPREVLSGVPQGSVLGPLLFVLFINDLPDNIKNITKLFADDLKLIVNAEDNESVVNDLSVLEDWESTWLLKFNVKKCKIMHLDFNNNPMSEYLLDGLPVVSIDSEKDLGLLTTKNLSWDDSIFQCIKDANRTIGWVSRNTLQRDPAIICHIYKTIIRPKLEYCVQMWNPAACHGNWSTILELEAIQRRFTRLASKIGTLPYSKRLEHMDLTTLGERRIRGDLIETFKVLNGIVEYGQNVFRTGRSGRNIISKVDYSKGASRDVGKLRSSFLPDRVKNYWNNLPSYVKCSNDVNIFKANLEKFKKECTARNENNFWEVSNLILDKIEGNPSYLANKDRHNAYLLDNPYVAKKKGINLY